MTTRKLMTAMGAIFLGTSLVVAGGGYNHGEKEKDDTDITIEQENYPAQDTAASTGEARQPQQETPDRWNPDDQTQAGREQDNIGNIEPGEVNDLQRRRQALRLGAAGFGPATFGGVDAEAAYNFYGGYLWEVNPHAAIKGIIDATTDFDQAVLASANLGGNLYIFNADVSPYIGGELGLAYLASGDPDLDDNFGFSTGASIGAQLFRTANTQMNLELGTRFHLQELDDDVPLMYTARVGVLF